MVRVSLRNLFLHKLRLLLTVAAVTVGVAFVSGTFVLSDTMGKAFDELFAGTTAGTDVVVRAESAYTDISTQGQVRPFDADLLDQVRAVPGVAVAEGSVNGFALVLDRAGEPIQPGGAPTLGVSIGSDAQLAGAFVFRDGRVPLGPDELVLDAGTAAKGGFGVGDPVDVVLADGRQGFTLVGIVGFGETDSLAGATMAGFDLTTAQQLLGKTGRLDEISVRAEDGVTTQQLRARIAAALPPGFEALTGEQVAEQGSAAVRDGLGVFTQVLLVFAAVSLFVGSFVIWNTFNVVVAQRRREVALLRAVGATRRQVLGGMMVEAAAIGIVASGIGLVSGVGLAVGIRALLKLTGIEVPATSAAVEPRTVLVALAVGLLVTVVAAVAPAWTASRVAPMEALREALPTGEGIGVRRRIAGGTLLVGGLLGLLVSAVVGDQALGTGLATLATFAGLVAAGPLLAQGMARLADRGRRGNGWRMAARTIARAPRRSAATALALTIGLTVVSAVAVTASSMKDSVAEAVSGGNRADLILKPTGVGGGISPAVADLLRRRDDLDTVVELRYSGAQVEDDLNAVVGVGPGAGIDEVMDLGVREGRLDLGPGQMLMAAAEARALGVHAGDRVRVTFPETGAVRLKVASVFDNVSLVGAPYVVSLDEFAANVTSPMDGAILVSAAPGADIGGVQAALDTSLADYSNVVVRDPAELTADAQASVDQMLGLVTALLLLAVVVAILGIVNTLVLSVVERTRELGLMRAVGATQRQVRTVVRRESVLMAVLGAVTGVALGTASGVALSRALADQGITQLAVPALTLAGYLVVATLVGVVAAIGPARRASKVDVLRAVTIE